MFEEENAKFSDGEVEKIMTSSEGMYLESNSSLFSNDIYSVSQDFSELIYYGEIEDNQPEGDGLIMRLIEKEMNKYIVIPVYIGEFKEGSFEGFGRTYQSASFFYEQFSTRTFVELDRAGAYYPEYEGYFSNGEFSGRGKYFVVKEDINSRSSLDEEFDYLTTYINENLDLIESTNNNNDDFMISKIPMLDTYVYHIGYYKNNVFNGQGTTYNINGGTTYIGEFKNNLYHGEGVKYDTDGKIQHEGSFTNGYAD